MSPSCFVCGEGIVPKKNSILPGQSTSLRRFLSATCELLNLNQVSEEDWDFIQSELLVCKMCYQLLEQVKSVQKQVLAAQRRLFDCLNLVASAVKDSSKHGSFEVSQWRSCCFKFRQELGNPVPKEGEIKIPSSFGPANQDSFDNGWQDDYDDDADNWSPPPQQFTEVPSKKRKIIVIAKEDEFPPAQDALQENDPLNFPQPAVKIEPEETPQPEEDETQPEEQPKPPTRKPQPKPNFPPGSKAMDAGPNIYTRLHTPFIIINDNLFLYKCGTFVEYNFTHLICKAISCEFKVPFDFYSSFQAMRDHLETSHRTRRHRMFRHHICVICDLSFTKQQTFRDHFAAKHPEYHTSVALGVCECCLRPCSYVGTRYHQAIHKNAEELAASQEQGKKSGLPARILAKGTPGHKKFRCTFPGCSYSTSESRNLKRHKNTHLPPELRTDLICCSVCGSQVVKDSLKHHMECFHSTKLDVGFTCPDCGKEFLAKDRIPYRNHLMVHRDERPFLCQLCGKRFVTRASLNAHRRTVHETEELTCEYCAKKFTKFLSFKKHVRVSHPGQPVPGRSGVTRPKLKGIFYREREIQKNKEKDPKWPCDLCGLICPEKESLERHKLEEHE